MRTKFWLESLNERDHLEDIVVDGIIILKCILGKIFGDVDWINLTQNRDRWRALVSNGLKNAGLRSCQ
jgi:hypothetical protein